MDWSSVVVVGLVVGCGPTVSETSGAGDGGSSEGGAPTTSTTSSPTAASASATSASSVGSTSTATEPTQCDEFVSVREVGPAVTLAVRNDSPEPVFIALGGCGGTIPLQIATAGQTSAWQPGDCFPERCEDFIEQGECVVGCPDCEGIAPLRIEPAGVYEFVWTGGLLSEHELPPACVSDMPCECDRLDQAGAGTYDLTMTVYAACVGDACECASPPTNGTCSVELYPTLDQMLALEVQLQYPDETSAQFIVES